MNNIKFIPLSKNKAVDMCTAMGFKILVDGYFGQDQVIKFELADVSLREKDLILEWYREDSLETNLMRASNILFKAGQKKKILQINKLEPLL